MDDIPDWLRIWLIHKALEGMERYIHWAWSTYGRGWSQAANKALIEWFILCQIVLADIIETIGASEPQEELSPAANYNFVMEQVRTEPFNFMPKIDPFASIRDSIQQSFKLMPRIDSFASIRNPIWNSFKPPILNMRYEPPKFQYVPPKMSYEPSWMTYKLPRLTFNNGFPEVIPGGFDFKPPMFKITPASIRIIPGGFRFID